MEANCFFSIITLPQRIIKLLFLLCGHFCWKKSLWSVLDAMATAEKSFSRIDSHLKRTLTKKGISRVCHKIITFVITEKHLFLNNLIMLWSLLYVIMAFAMMLGLNPFCQNFPLRISIQLMGLSFGYCVTE